MLMGLSVRLFGLSSWSILLPEALAGVATVAVLYLAVRRSFGPAAATIAGLVMALTPVAVLIFRYNNPDALLTLLLVTAAWAFLRALEAGRLRWVRPRRGPRRPRLQHEVPPGLPRPAGVRDHLPRRCPGKARPAARRRSSRPLATVLVTSGWWVLAVELIPAAARPFIGGSTTNSALELVFGYDGLGRIFGAQRPRAAAPGVVPAVAAGSAAPSGSSDSSTPSSAARSAGSSRSRSSAWRPGLAIRVDGAPDRSAPGPAT